MSDMYQLKKEIYREAFLYKKNRIWKRLRDDQLFAIALPRGETGYVCVMGKSGEYYALSVYLGDEGALSYMKVALGSAFTGDPFRDKENALGQNCVQMILDTKENVPPEQLEETRRFAQEFGVRLAGKNAYPVFLRFRRGYHPWHILSREDHENLLEALRMTNLLSEALQDSSVEEYEIEPFDLFSEEVPLFERKGETIRLKKRILLTDIPEEEYPFVKAGGKKTLESVCKMPHKGIWEAEIVRFLEAVQETPDEVPYYPLMLILVEKKSHFLLPMDLSMDFEKKPETLLKELTIALRELGYCPKVIRINDERTYAYLKDYCAKTGIRIERDAWEMETLMDVKISLATDFPGNSDSEVGELGMLAGLLELVLDMNDRELRTLPRNLVQEIEGMINANFFPPDLAAEFKRRMKIAKGH